MLLHHSGVQHLERRQRVTLPACFCWTRFGTEAGQAIDQIFERKEQERLANGGVFFWGIGNAIGPSIKELLRRTPNPEVLFSPIKSVPRLADSAPEVVAAWGSAETLEGESFRLPESSLVTSRYDPGTSSKDSRYALVCSSSGSLEETRCDEKIALANLRNLITGRPVGSSQVTAVVSKLNGNIEGMPNYTVHIRATLVYPYFVRLRDPILLSKPDQDWGATVRQIWEDRLAISLTRPISKTSRLLS
jgi:hypothetical protein